MKIYVKPSGGKLIGSEEGPKADPCGTPLQNEVQRQTVI